MHVYSTLRRASVRARWLTGFIVALMALPVLTASAASVLPAPPWTIQPTNNPGTFNLLNGVSCPSATRCAAAGFDHNGSRDLALPELWNGIKWQDPVPVKGDPLLNADSEMNAASCPTTTECELVGVTGNNGTLPLAAIWNGKLGKASISSQSVQLPPGSTLAELNGVSCTSVSACTAVGSYADAAGVHTLVERWDGSSWQIQPTGPPAGVFSAVSCTSATFCMAVGNHGPNELVSVWNGSTWLVILASNFNGATFALLSGVSCTADGSCIMVGETSGPQGSTTGIFNLALKWIRGEFFLLSTANLSATLNELQAVSCTSSSDCLAVGLWQDFRGLQDTLAEHWNGSTWQYEATPNPVGTLADLRGVSCSSATVCTAVGSFKTFSGEFETLAERFVAAGSPHGFSLTSKGTVLALLRKQRTLELLVFQRGRHGHLLGPVALGSHPKGLSRIPWNLRVGGKKLSAGSYTAELVAVFGRGVTSDGPSVTFDLTRAGLVRVRSATCSVAAAEQGRC